MSLVFRQATLEDIAAIASLSAQMWYSRGQGDGEDLSRPLALNDTLHLFEATTTSRVALLDGKLVGAALAAVAGEPGHTSDVLEAIREGLDSTATELKATERGAHVYEYFMADRADTAALSKRAPTHDSSELLLFIVSPEARGHRIGTRMLSEIEQQVREAGHSHYFLYTDSSCDYGFYDHRGFKRIDEHLGAPSFDGQTYDKFIYEAHLD